MSDYRHFVHPVLTAILRGAKARYCSCDVGAHGQTYEVLARPQAGDLSVLREVLIREGYRAVLPLLPGRPLRVVDIGAHIGMFALWLGRQTDIASVTCFEPEPESAKLCLFNLAQMAQATVVQAAVGATARQGTVLIDPAGSSRSTLVPGLGGREHNTKEAATKVISLPSWLEQHGPVDLMKMDCEGSEWELVRQCPSVFSAVTTLVAEVHEDPVEHRSQENFQETMRELGFRIVNHPYLFLGTRTEPFKG
jgi:FkbM family methyltransferase